jgi:hypothetical protein
MLRRRPHLVSRLLASAAPEEEGAMAQPKVVQLSTAASVLQKEPDFSLVLGGPLYQMYLRTRLARPPLELFLRRELTLSLICWLPLFLLSAAAGNLTGGVPVPFLRDPEVHIRFLLALPLLIASEVYVHRRMRNMAPQFLARGIVAPGEQARFEKIVASTMRLRNSAIVEAIILGLVLTVGHWIWTQNFTLTISTWYRLNDAAGLHLTAAGWFYSFVSLSIFRFLLVRWYFRLFIWYLFLWRVRAMPLHLNLYHPDRAGGLGFLSGSATALAPVFVAQTMVVAGTIFAHILYTGEQASDFRMEVFGFLVFAVLAVIFPLGFFMHKLEQAGRRGRLEFGTLASHYVDDFHSKWIDGGVRDSEPLLGTSDIQSLADLANSFSVVNQMRLLPISREALIRLVIIVALPLLPLVLTKFPLDELIRRLFKLAF